MVIKVVAGILKMFDGCLGRKYRNRKDKNDNVMIKMVMTCWLLDPKILMKKR